MTKSIDPNATTGGPDSFFDEPTLKPGMLLDNKNGSSDKFVPCLMNGEYF